MKHHARPVSEKFTRTDCRRLKRALKAAHEARLYRRLEAVLFVAETGSVSEAARRVHAPRFSVRRWAQRYLKRHDPRILDERARSGRPRLQVPLTARGWRKLLASDPRSFGYRATCWTVPLLTQHLRESFDLAISEWTVRRRLHEERFRYKRPRYRYSERAEALGSKKGGLFDA